VQVHAVVFNVTIGGDPDEAATFLREQIVPRVKEAPGFVAGYWVRLPNGKGIGVATFDSEEAARGALDQGPPPAPGVIIDSADVGEVVASA
jgi:hypothetical protein